MRGKQARKIRKEARLYMSQRWLKINEMPWYKRLALAFCILFGVLPEAWRILA